ncbi:unnamed protein product [Prorocentrum cordatum]|uniref:Uncharacterized protein n=1 Tax=Prorocentrum cordatum TaxID=2364126 RepID=A0ABN9RZW6_9DINO|nr:unnamed protein product [Polarella glacialis]
MCATARLHLLRNSHGYRAEAQAPAPCTKHTPDRCVSGAVGCLLRQCWAMFAAVVAVLPYSGSDRILVRAPATPKRTRGAGWRIKSTAAADAELWEDEDFLKFNNVSSSSAFCFTVLNDTNSAEQDGDEEIFQLSEATFSGNKTGIVTSKSGHKVGHWCCQGHLPNRSQLASTNCYQTNKQGALEQVRVGEGLLQTAVGADGSVVASSVKKHGRSGLMRSDKTAAQGDDMIKDPRIFPTQIFMASLRDGVDSDSLALAVEQVAHLARATSGLIVVDQRLFARLMKELGSHPSRFRVIEKWLVFAFWVGVYAFRILGSVALGYGIEQAFKHR